MIDFHLAAGWSGLPGFWGVMSSAAEHTHCNTTTNSTQLLEEGKGTMPHIKVVDRWADGKPTPISPNAKF